MAITRTTLSAAIDADERFIPLASTTGMLAGDWITIGQEIMQVNRIPVAGTAKVQRGQGGTRSLAHTVTSSVEFGQRTDFGAFGTRETDGPSKGFGLPLRPVTRLSADGGIGRHGGTVILTGSDTAYTLALPTPAEDGVELFIFANAATAFVITTVDGFRGDSTTTDDDTATFGGAIGDLLHLVADGDVPVWQIVSSKNITFA